MTQEARQQFVWNGNIIGKWEEFQWNCNPSQSFIWIKILEISPQGFYTTRNEKDSNIITVSPEGNIN